MRSSRSMAQVQQPLYDADYYGWTQEQVRALRAGDARNIDWENVAEELDDSGKNVRGEIHSRLELIISHLRKMAYQPEKRTPNWENTIDEQRSRVDDLLRKNPSRKNSMDEVLVEAYEYGRRAAGNEMGLSLCEWRRQLPAECPWSRSEILNPSFVPKPRARASSCRLHAFAVGRRPLNASRSFCPRARP